MAAPASTSAVPGTKRGDTFLKIKITADSTCDLSEALLRQWDISLMPMHILMLSLIHI